MINNNPSNCKTEIGKPKKEKKQEQLRLAEVVGPFQSG
jgi:hypothetical protein